jgi:hypothetical protein
MLPNPGGYTGNANSGYSANTSQNNVSGNSINSIGQANNSYGQNTDANAAANALNQTGAQQGAAMNQTGAAQAQLAQDQGQGVAGQGQMMGQYGQQLSGQGLAQSNQANQAQQGALGLMASAAQGNQPSVAQQQQSQGINQGIQAQLAAANSARGGPQSAAAAAQAASTTGGNMQAQAVSQGAALRAQEMAQAQQNYGGMANSMQASAQQGQNLGLQTQQAGLQGQTAGYGLGLQGMQTGNQMQQAGGQLQQGYAGLGTNVQQSQLQADTATSQMNAQTAQANAANNTKLFGGVMNSVGSIASMVGSDVRIKRDVKPMGLGSYAEIHSPADVKADIAPQNTDYQGTAGTSDDPTSTQNQQMGDPYAEHSMDAAYGQATAGAGKDPNDPMVDKSGQYDWQAPAQDPNHPAWENNKNAYAPGSEDDKVGGANGWSNMGGRGPQSPAFARSQAMDQSQAAGGDSLAQVDAGQDASKKAKSAPKIIDDAPAGPRTPDIAYTPPPQYKLPAYSAPPVPNSRPLRPDDLTSDMRAKTEVREGQEDVRPAPRDTTPLTPAAEKKFRAWTRQMGVTDADEPNAFYDYRGAYKAGVKPGADRHWPDTFKQHGHPTFSNESQYAGEGEGGAWAPDGRFLPPLPRSLPPVDVISDMRAKTEMQPQSVFHTEPERRPMPQQQPGAGAQPPPQQQPKPQGGGAAQQGQLISDNHAKAEVIANDAHQAGVKRGYAAAQQQYMTTGGQARANQAPGAYASGAESTPDMWANHRSQAMGRPEAAPTEDPRWAHEQQFATTSGDARPNQAPGAAASREDVAPDLMANHMADDSPDMPQSADPRWGTPRREQMHTPGALVQNPAAQEETDRTGRRPSMIRDSSAPEMVASEPPINSSKDEKTDVHGDEVLGFLETLKPYSYRYKDPSMEPSASPNGGRYLGVMAQNLELGPTGKQIVKDTPRGKVLETNSLVSALAAGEGSLHERLSRLEAMAGRRR